MRLVREPSVIESFSGLDEEKNNLLSKRFGDDWRSIGDFDFFASIIDADAVVTGNEDNVDNVSTTQLISVNGIGDREVVFDEMRLRIRYRLPDIRLMFGETSENTLPDNQLKRKLNPCPSAAPVQKANASAISRSTNDSSMDQVFDPNVPKSMPLQNKTKKGAPTIHGLQRHNGHWKRPVVNAPRTTLHLPATSVNEFVLPERLYEDKLK
ncbi:hypothetical protein ANN_19235, partial [Periplaneta americana]